jgi:putative transposase
MIKTFKYKLYQSKKNKFLDEQTRISGNIYNHCIALKKRYYKMYHKTLNKYKLQKHLTKLKRLDKYSFWNKVGSQAIQDITDRIERAYQAFFKNCKKKTKTRKVSPPSFKKAKLYPSFTLKQAGFKIMPFNQIKINKKIYKYHKSRNLEGEIKCVSIKKDTLGDWYIYFVCIVSNNPKLISKTGKTAGFDFGCTTLLTQNNGDKFKSPLFFKQNRSKIKKADKLLSSKTKNSNNYKKARMNLNRIHKKIANQRKDYHFKLSLDLIKQNDIMFFETLNIESMKKEHGRKINDLGFSDLVNILEYKCKMNDRVIHFIDKWYPSSQICNHCKFQYKDLSIRERSWKCPSCGHEHDRDINAAMNIFDKGNEELLELISSPVGSPTGRLESVRLDEPLVSQASLVAA